MTTRADVEQLRTRTVEAWSELHPDVPFSKFEFDYFHAEMLIDRVGVSAISTLPVLIKKRWARNINKGGARMSYRELTFVDICACYDLLVQKTLETPNKSPESVPEPVTIKDPMDSPKFGEFVDWVYDTCIPGAKNVYGLIKHRDSDEYTSPKFAENTVEAKICRELVRKNKFEPA